MYGLILKEKLERKNFFEKMWRLSLILILLLGLVLGSALPARRIRAETIAENGLMQEAEGAENQALDEPGISRRTGPGPSEILEHVINPYAYHATSFPASGSLRLMDEFYKRDDLKLARLWGLDRVPGASKQSRINPSLYLRYEFNSEEANYYDFVALCADHNRKFPVERDFVTEPLSRGLSKLLSYNVREPEEMAKQLTRGIQILWLAVRAEGQKHLPGIPTEHFAENLAQKYLWMRLKQSNLEYLSLQNPESYERDYGTPPSDEALTQYAIELFASVDEMVSVWEQEVEIDGAEFTYFPGEYLDIAMPEQVINLYSLSGGFERGRYYEIESGVYLAFMSDHLSLYFTDQAAERITLSFSTSPSLRSEAEVPEPQIIFDYTTQSLIPLTQEAKPRTFSFTLLRGEREPDPEPDP
ncbi:MAG: hypothetical protein Q4P08_05415, partial [Eubacteriales bacterium]|nr:hypothetical protein [Eubacteriales bacterium]